MSREIKFMAWDDVIKKMLDGYEIEESEFIKTYLSYGELIIGCFPKDADYYELTPLQFTGLHDKNGKEIYEGDIMCFPKYEGKKYQIRWVVEWNEENARYTDWHPREEAEVIGNIYENPELLDK